MSPAVLTQVIARTGSVTHIDTPDYYKRLEESELKTLEVVSTVKTWYRAFGSRSHQLSSKLALSPIKTKGRLGGSHAYPVTHFQRCYLSRALADLGFIALGHDDSPVIPLLASNTSEMPLFSRLMKERKFLSS